MSFYHLSPLVACIVNLALALFVLQRDHKSSAHRILFLFLLSAGLWCVAIFAMRRSPDVETALWRERFVLATVPLLAVSYSHFVSVVTKARVKRFLLFTVYIVTLLFVISALVGLQLNGMKLKSFGFVPVFNQLALISLLWSYSLVLASLSHLLKSYRNCQPTEKKCLAYVIIGTVIYLAGTISDIVPPLGLSSYPLGTTASIIFCFLCTVSIVKYNLLGIGVLIRKGLAYTLVSGLVVGAYVLLVLLINRTFHLQEISLAINVVLTLAIVIVLQPMLRLVQNVVDKWFYRDRYDYLRALQTFTQHTQSLTDSVKLSSMMVKLVAGALRSSTVCFFQPLSPGGDYALTSSIGVNKPADLICFSRRAALVRWLERADGVLSYQDLDIIPQLQSIHPREREYLKKMRTELIVPLKTRGSGLSGLLLLGQKLSQLPYSTEDKQLVRTLAGQVAINLENARLYTNALRARESLETWLNSMTDCVMIVNTDYTIRFMNKTAVENFGGKASGTCWNSLGKDNNCPSCPIQQYLCGSRESCHFPNSIRGKHYDAAIAPLLNPDGSMSVVEVLRDVTERKLAKEREKQLQEELNHFSQLASIGELAAGVAHEINNPLTGIIGFSERLLRKIADKDVTRDLERIHSDAWRAARVVQNLLTFARRRESKKEYEDINDILRRTLELRAYELQTGNIEVALDLAPGLPKALVDSHQIQEVFLNIILNAEQAMTEIKGGGKLNIKTENLKGYIRISFADDGPGISADHLDKVFDPFFTTRGENGGTGLGLSVCHGIVTEHGGKIYVKSKPGKGATFFVELSLAREEKDRSKVVHKGSAYLKSKHNRLLPS